MVARRQRHTRHTQATADEAALTTLAAVPLVDEDPTLFWGADFWGIKAEIEAEQAAGSRRVLCSEEEFEALLDQFSKRGADLRGE